MFILYHLHPLSISSFIIFIIYYPHPLSISSFIIFILYHPHPLSSSSFINLILYHVYPLSSSSFINLILYHPFPLTSSSFIILILYHIHPLSSSSFIILIVLIKFIILRMPILLITINIKQDVLDGRAAVGIEPGTFSPGVFWRTKSSKVEKIRLPNFVLQNGFNIKSLFKDFPGNLEGLAQKHPKI